MRVGREGVLFFDDGGGHPAPYIVSEGGASTPRSSTKIVTVSLAPSLLTTCANACHTGGGNAAGTSFYLVSRETNALRH